MFLIAKKTESTDIGAALEILKSQLKIEPIKKNVGAHNVFLYRKKLIALEEVFIEFGSGSWIFGVGTWAYRSKIGRDGLLLFFEDVQMHKMDSSLVRGQFTFILSNNDDNLKIFTDRSGIQNIYYTDCGVISSSFLASVYSRKKPCSLDQQAAYEVLTTGHIISPDTLVNEVKRFFPLAEISAIDGCSITIINSNPSGIPEYLDYESALESQVNNLDELFKSFSDIQKYTADFGITGGLDSRLLLSFAKKNWEKKSIRLYTNSRIVSFGHQVVDEPISELVSESSEIDLKLGLMKDPLSLTDEEIVNTIHESFLFFDGHVRMHIQYFEAYNTERFKLKVLGDSRFNTSGIGGEQYRNMERFNGKKWPLREFLKYKTILFVSGEALVGKEKNFFLDGLAAKVKKRLDVDDSLDFIGVKKYYNEVLNGDRLGARNNMENKLSWFLSPFVDWKIAESAYGLTPFLLNDYFFLQSKMIGKGDSTLAQIPTDYGFTPSNGLPVKDMLKEKLLSNVPWQLFYWLRVKRLHKPGSYSFFNQLVKNASISKYSDTVRTTLPAINIDKVLSTPDVMPIAISLGYLISNLREKGKLI